MFSKFSNTIRSFLGTSGSDQESVDKSAPSEQLYAELSDALNQDMVTTRRQSHGLPNEDLRDGSEIDTPRTASKKRNLPASSIPVVRSAKRRKSTAQDTGSDGGASESNLQDGATHVDTANGTGVKVVKQDEGDSDVDKQRLVPELENTESRSRTNGKSSNGKDTQALASAETGIPNLATDQEEQKNPTTIKVADPEPTLSPPNPKRYSQPVPVSSGQSTAKATSSITKAKISKATHLRFGSEEPGVEALPAEKEQALSETMSANTVENLEKSDEDDEAPEFVTASAGADTARARAMEEAKAVER